MPGALRRRGLLASAGLVAAAPAGLVRSATVLVPGPAGAAPARLAERLAESCARGPGGGIQLRWSLLGGPDGVTAANRFATEAAPDGHSLLLAPGAAAMARLVGEPRARFDASLWQPVLALQQPSLIVVREAPAGRPLRLAVGAPEGVTAAVLLGFEMMGIAAVPVLGLGGARAEAALGEGAVEAALLQGEALAARASSLGARPLFTLEPAGGRDPALPETTSLLDLPGDAAPLRQALQAAIACARLQAALVLPALTPAPVLGQWRGASQRWVEEETRAGRGGRAATGVEAQAVMAGVVAPAAARQAYQAWLAQRFGWRPE